jgi:hypothetical protein
LLFPMMKSPQLINNNGFQFIATLFKIGVIYMYWFFKEQVTKGRNSNNLIKMNMDVLKKHASVFYRDVTTILLSFRIDGANVF